jgi:hypothetical protein
MSAVPRLKQYVVGCSEQGLGFDTRPAHVRFVLDNAALRQIFLRYFVFPRHDHSTNVPPSYSPYMLLLTGQTGETENLPKTSDLS